MTGAIPILFVHYGDDWIRGSEVVLLDLLGALDKEKVRPIVWCNGTQMANATRAAGYLTYQDEFRHMFDYGSPRPSASHFLGLVRKCRALCREHGVRVLHANGLAPVQWLAPAGITERVPVLAHLHTDYLRRSRYVLLVHAATLIVGVSRQVIDGPVQDGVSPERARVIYNGIDFSRLGESKNDLRAVLGIPMDAFVVATTGSLIKRKGHDVLIRAFHGLPVGPVPSHLIVAGSGPELDVLRELSTTLAISDRIHFLGNTDDVASVYTAADLFALASRGDAFGLALAEAAHFGLPAVSTRVGGIPEVVLHGQTGLLTAADDVPAFTNALAKLMNDRALRLRLGAAAAKRVEENFTAPRMARRFEDAYAELGAVSKRQSGWSHALRRLFLPYSKLAGRSPTQPRYTS